MNTSEIFQELLVALKLGDAAATITSRRDEITKALNKDFRARESCVDYKLMVGSFGRNTAIKGVSDLDLIYILPPIIRERYAGETGPRRILERVRNTLKARYPTTDIRVDQCVVRVQFVANAFKFDVQPAFENGDGSFSYPDTMAKNWRITKPRDEIRATAECSHLTSTNMRHLARMVRAWKNTNGVLMSGLLIDTLVYRFFQHTREFDSVGTGSFDRMVRDFFKFLKDEPEQAYYLALGSHQRVDVKGRFQSKAAKAYACCAEAMTIEDTSSVTAMWRQVFGPAVTLATRTSKDAISFRNTEEFIEHSYPVNITDSVEIDCYVSQNGWRPMWLRTMLATRTLLKADKVLRFQVVACSVPKPYIVKWKVLNRGPEAERRGSIRGQIIDSTAPGVRSEHSDFRGEHLVECYVIKNGVVVARDRIDVPISNTRLDSIAP